MMRDLFLPIPAQPSIESLLEYAEAAEKGGYDRVWLAETWGRDAVTTLTTIATQTDEIGLGTSISSVYSRSPALLGQTAATLHEVSRGRFRLGLGQSTPQLVEGWHGVPHSEPLRRLRESVEIVRQVLSGDVVVYDSNIFEMEGFRLRFEPPSPPPAIDVAAMGPKSMELAGRFADGCHTTMATPGGLADSLDNLETGADLGARNPEDVRVTVELPCCALDDGKRARELVRHHIAFYLGAMGVVYRDHLARQGYEAEAEEIARFWNDGQQDAAMAVISDDLLDSLGVAGTPEQACQQLRRWEALESVDVVAVLFPVHATRDDILATIETLAPEM
ncbi:TIGR04024 family LLM class F420-dependent oxidoreductase [Natronorubrum halophilum]|uniref:TIGR04024 family LLM class F420-dependent oxidoreductase n=1 Tax=Natronorubrum halophilum TaxID=1702106 RepID=UPI000EF6678B|nr:TIGR04024 family LLM class F420-dependent oxidoreductase [Natronorubrum halophilum]